MQRVQGAGGGHCFGMLALGYRASQGVPCPAAGRGETRGQGLLRRMGVVPGQRLARPLPCMSAVNSTVCPLLKDCCRHDGVLLFAGNDFSK